MSEIIKTVAGPKGRYHFSENGAEAEITFSILSPHRIIADHTGVPDAMRGTGAGKRLVEFMVADARENGIKIIPLCPFINAERRKHPEWTDVFQV